MRSYTTYRSVTLLSLLLGLSGVAGPTLQARETPTVGRCVSAETILLRRAAPGEAWRVVSAKDALHAGELLVGAPGASLESSNGAVRLTFLGEMTGTSAYPVRETAIVVHESKDVDLDVTLDRGRLDLVNRKEKGPARVRIRLRDRAAEIVLTNPKSRLALEIFGRWLPGVPFRKEPRANEAPVLAVVVIALAGEVQIKGKDKHFRLKAPPGPALLHLDGLDIDVAPQHLERLPDWARGTLTDRQKKLRGIVARLRELAVKKSIEDGVDTLVKSKDPDERRIAVYAMGATDDLRHLAEVMATTPHRDVWDNGVMTLRHWIGRGPGQDQKLYKALIDIGRMPEPQAQTVLQLLHDLAETDIENPLTYQVLIRLLSAERLAIRGLAYWHLSRLAPAGRNLGYDPVAPKEKREAAIKRWQALIPPGKMPPKPMPRDH